MGDGFMFKLACRRTGSCFTETRAGAPCSVLHFESDVRLSLFPVSPRWVELWVRLKVSDTGHRLQRRRRSAHLPVRRIVPGSRRIKMVPAPSRITFLRTGRCALRLPDTFNRMAPCKGMAAGKAPKAETRKKETNDRDRKTDRRRKPGVCKRAGNAAAPPKWVSKPVRKRVATHCKRVLHRRPRWRHEA